MLVHSFMVGQDFVNFWVLLWCLLPMCYDSDRNMLNPTMLQPQATSLLLVEDISSTQNLSDMIFAYYSKLGKRLSTKAMQLLPLTACRPSTPNKTTGVKMGEFLSKNSTDSHCSNSRVSSFSRINASLIDIACWSISKVL